MCDLLDDPETLIPLAEAARRLPRRRMGRPTSASTLWRWAMVGCHLVDGRVVKLPAVRIGRVWMTSPTALAAFLRALQPKAGWRCSDAP